MDRLTRIKPVTIEFDLPYNLDVEGEFRLNSIGHSYYIILRTVKESTPRFPGASYVSGLTIISDDSNIISHTNVVVSYVPLDEYRTSQPNLFSSDVFDIAVNISNALISAARIAYGEYHLEYLYSANRLGPIQFSVPSIAGEKPYQGVSDKLQGGITLGLPARTGKATVDFAKALMDGASLSPASELLFDAKRYLMRGNNRMALANLAISFEVGLADRLTEIAASRNDAALEHKIARAALNDLGTKFATQMFGHSFAERKYWSDRFVNAFEWLRIARNGILHKVRLNLEFNGHRRDFNSGVELNSLFVEHDWLLGEIDAAVLRVLAGQPALP